MSDTLNVTEGRVDPRVKRTRQLLIKAFEGLMAEKSLEAITVQDIADRATVNRATFYAHFEDKFDLLDQAFEERFAQVLHKNLPIGSEYSPMNLQLLIQSICEFLDQLHDHCKPSTGTQLDAQLEQGVRRQLQALLARWMGSKGNDALAQRDAELRATVAGCAIYGAGVWRSQQARRELAPEFAAKVLPMIIPMLDAQESLAVKATSSNVNPKHR